MSPVVRAIFSNHGVLAAVHTACLALLLASSLSCGTRRWGDLDGTETRVLIVANSEDGSSLDLAYEYARRRGIARSHVIRLDLPRTEDINRTTFDRRLRRPIVDWWRGQPTDSRPDFICLMPGIPHRIRGDEGLDGTRASVDSELCALPVWAAGQEVVLPGRLQNPYYRPGPPYPAFRWQDFGICLVTRLSGWDDAQVRALLERSLAAAPHDPIQSTPDPGGAQSAKSESTPDPDGAHSARTESTPDPDEFRPALDHTGGFLLDQNGNESPGNDWLETAAQRLASLGHSVKFDSVAAFVTEADSLLGYAAWGSNDGQYERDFAFTWVPGALATTYVSSSARTFQEPPPGWKPGPAADVSREFGGTTQSLITDLLASGATGVAGNVYEPYLDACARPQVLFPAYVSGRNLAESFYLSLPYLSWQAVVVGDPLCRISQ